MNVLRPTHPFCSAKDIRKVNNVPFNILLSIIVIKIDRNPFMLNATKIFQ